MTDLDLRLQVEPLVDGVPIDLATSIDPLTTAPWAFAMVSATQNEVVYSNRLRNLMAHVIGQHYAMLDENDEAEDLSLGLPSRFESLHAVADSATRGFILANEAIVDDLSEVEMVALMIPSMERPAWLAESGLDEWTSALPLYVVESAHHWPFKIPGQTSIDATTDLTWMQAAHDNHLIRLMRQPVETPDF